MAKRVFFSFHYQDVIDFRANIVRNHWLTKKDREEAGYFDASIWETAKKTGDITLKRLINGAFDYTTVTVVLIGTETYQRRWVKYEIMKSLARGNKIIGVHINSIPGKDKKVKQLGLNPFNYLGVKYSDDGKKLFVYELSKSNQWIVYTDLEGWTLDKQISKNLWGKFLKLSNLCLVYDWVKNEGYNNFATWVSSS